MGVPIMRSSRKMLPLAAAAGAAVVSVAMAAPAAAAVTTLYVDKANGQCSNSGPGTQTTPFCTISGAAAKVVAGQTVQVSAGTYSEKVTVARSGTSGAPIVFAAASGATVTVTGGADGFVLSGKSNVAIRGFRITATSGPGITASSGSNLTIAGNDVSGAGKRVNGSTAKGISLSGITNSTISGNVTHDNSDAGIGLGSGSNGNTLTGNNSYANARGYSRAAAGIDLRNSTGNTVSANLLHNNEDSGLNIWTSSSNTLAVNNSVYNNGDHGIDVHSTNDARVVANTVYKNYDSGIEMTGSLRTVLANNISADNGINSARTSGQLRADSTSAASTVADYDLLNQSAPLGSKTVFIDWAGTKYATLAAFTKATGKEAHGIQADPQLAANLHLTAGSPAIDSANAAAPGEPAKDADGRSRVDIAGVPNTGAGSPPYADRGAFEFRG